MCDNIFIASQQLSIKQVKETLKTACAYVYSGDYEKLGQLQVAIELFIASNDMGDEVYKQKCLAYDLLDRQLKKRGENIIIEV